MGQNNLFIKRRFQVKKAPETGEVSFAGSIYIAYYFYIDEELYVSRYAFCVRFSKSEAELKALLNR